MSCSSILRLNLERVNAARSAELELPEGSILVNQMEYIVEVLMKFEPSLQLKTRTTPGNQESFATKPTFTAKTPSESEQAEYPASLQALMQDEIVEIRAECHKSTCNRWLLGLDSLENSSRYCLGKQQTGKADNT